MKGVRRIHWIHKQLPDMSRAESAAYWTSVGISFNRDWDSANTARNTVASKPYGQRRSSGK